MNVDLRNALRLSFVTAETELPIPPVSKILARLRSCPAGDARRSPLPTTSSLFFTSSGTKTMDSSFGATRTRIKKATVFRGLSLMTWAFLAGASPAWAADIYIQASVDEAGQLVILRQDGRTTVLKKEPEQVGFDKIAISADGRSVGWVALYPNCCTSYPIPLKLLIYSGGRLRAFTGAGLPVWLWRFVAGGRRVVFEQETVHGGLGTHYELRDVASGRLIDEWNPAVGPDNQRLATQKPPPWVAELDAKQP